MNDELDILGTIKNCKMPDLLKVRRVVNAAINRLKARRPKANKGKGRKAPKPDAEGWRTMAQNEDHCWACGRTRQDVPHFWWAPWLLERAHVVNKTRLRSPKVCVVLCSCCHRLSHGEHVAGCTMPPLTKAHLLHILMERQPVVDWPLLKKHNVGELPEPEHLPIEYITSMYRFCGSRRDAELAGKEWRDRG